MPSSQLLARTHFENNVDFLDLFLDKLVPSRNRARAFLWLVYHYLEDPSSSISSPGSVSTNPFADDHSREHLGRVPELPRYTPEQMRTKRENVDTKEELDVGARMCEERHGYLRRYSRPRESGRRPEDSPSGKYVISG